MFCCPLGRNRPPASWIPCTFPRGSAVPSGPDRSSAATTLVRSRTHPASPFPVVAPQQCETSSAAGCAAVEESPASVVRVFGDLTDRWRHRSCVALRRASTARTRRWASSLSGMLSFIPAAASLAQRDGAPVPAPRCRAGTDRAGTARALPQPRLKHGASGAAASRSRSANRGEDARDAGRAEMTGRVRVRGAKARRSEVGSARVRV
jgi:hypothetical protein